MKFSATEVAAMRLEVTPMHSEYVGFYLQFAALWSAAIFGIEFERENPLKAFFFLVCAIAFAVGGRS